MDSRILNSEATVEQKCDLALVAIELQAQANPRTQNYSNCIFKAIGGEEFKESDGAWSTHTWKLYSRLDQEVAIPLLDAVVLREANPGVALKTDSLGDAATVQGRTRGHCGRALKVLDFLYGRALIDDLPQPAFVSYLKEPLFRQGPDVTARVIFEFLAENNATWNSKVEVTQLLAETVSRADAAAAARIADGLLALRSENPFTAMKYAEIILSVVDRRQASDAASIHTELARMFAAKIEKDYADDDKRVNSYILRSLFRSLKRQSNQFVVAKAWAPVARTLMKLIEKEKDPVILGELAASLGAVIDLVGVDESARTCGAVAKKLTAAIEKQVDQNAEFPLARGLAAMAIRAPHDQGVDIARALGLRAKQQSKETRRKRGMDRDWTSLTAGGVCNVAGGLDSKDSARAARIIAAGIRRETDAEVRWWLMAALGVVGKNMEPADWTEVCGPYAREVAEVLLGLDWCDWVEVVSKLAPKTSHAFANQAAVVWLNALDREKDPIKRRALLLIVLAAADHTSPSDQSVFYGRLARLITDELNAATGRGDGWTIARLVAKTAKILDPAESLRFLASALERETNRAVCLELADGIPRVMRMSDSAGARRMSTDLARSALKSISPKNLATKARRVSLTRLEPSDADKLYDLVPALLPHLGRGVAHRLAWEIAAQFCSGPDANDDPGRTDYDWRPTLPRMLADADGTGVALRTATRTALAFAPFPVGPIIAQRVAAEPVPCPLTTQELVELLKMPTCFGQARRVVLDQLGNRYGRRFSNHWAFVRYAQERNLELDFTTPPTRPDRKESIKRMLEILDRREAG